MKSQEIKFKNTGNEPMIISNAKGSCGCTVPQWPKEPIAPGESGEINVQFNSKNKTGAQNKRVTINIDIYPSEMKLPDLNGLEIIIYSVSHFIFYIAPLILKESKYLFSKFSSAFKQSVISNVFIHNFP